MIKVAVDTHALLWYFYNDPRLSQTVQTHLDAEILAGNDVAVSSVTLVEIIYLVEKNKIPLNAFQEVTALLVSGQSGFVEVPLDRVVAIAMHQVARTAVPDMPDRIIAATALSLNVPLISRDAKIQVSGIQTIW